VPSILMGYESGGSVGRPKASGGYRRDVSFSSEKGSTAWGGKRSLVVGTNEKSSNTRERKNEKDKRECALHSTDHT